MAYMSFPLNPMPKPFASRGVEGCGFIGTTGITTTHAATRGT
jgi:hypothetical protein